MWDHNPIVSPGDLWQKQSVVFSFVFHRGIVLIVGIFELMDDTVKHVRSIASPTVIALSLTMFAISCASGPDTGVRADFEQRQVDRVAVVPFYSSSTFGIDAELFDTIHDQYEQAAVEALSMQGFDVVGSQTLRHQMTELDMWDDFRDGIRLRQSLEAYFEPAPAGSNDSIEIRTVRQLASQGGLPARALLFGEIVYHSQGTCREKASDHNSYAELQITSSAPSLLPRPCVSSHFQAKLVDAATGHTMWFNRVFIETHSGNTDDATVSDTITAAVHATIAGDDGPATIAPDTGPRAHTR